LTQEISTVKQDNVKLSGDLQQCQNQAKLILTENSKIAGFTKNLDECNNSKSTLTIQITTLNEQLKNIPLLQNQNKQLAD